MSRVGDLAQRLRRQETRAHLPLPCAEDAGASLFHAPEWSPLAGAPSARELDARRRRELSRHEAAAFFSANVHAERRFVASVTHRLARGDAAHADYLRHLVEEETTHAQLFEQACVSWLGGLHQDRSLAFDAPPRRPLEEDLVLHGQLVIFEEITDAHDAAHACDERIARCVREIHAAHHADEARHLAFGRALLRDLAEQARRDLPHDARARVARDLAVAWGACWRAIATSEPARRTGLADPAAAREEAWRNPAFAALRARVLAQRLTGLLACGLLPEDMTP
jgi:hypothetical protein